MQDVKKITLKNPSGMCMTFKITLRKNGTQVHLFNFYDSNLPTNFASVVTNGTTLALETYDFNEISFPLNAGIAQYAANIDCLMD